MRGQRIVTSTFPHKNSSNYSLRRIPILIVPRLDVTPKLIDFRVCQTYRYRSDVRYILIPENHTLEQMKNEICRDLKPKRKPTEISLTIFDETNYIWVPIHDTNIHKTIGDLNLPRYSTINVEEREETNINQQHSSKIQHNDLILKLCRRPMDKSEFINLYTRSTATIGQLKEDARQHAITQKSSLLCLWTNDNWTKFETKLDDLTLAELRFEEYSIISFESENDPIPGVCGLTNLGNTCFMNSALQCLSNIPEFTRKVLSFGDEMNAPIAGAFKTLIRTIWSGEYAVTTPSSLLLNIRENLPRFSRYRQQDAQEFMNYFLHLIHQEFTDERSIVTDFFYGRLRSNVKCLGGCYSVESNEETISFLPLPIENDVNQYNILYVQKNGEQRLLSVRTVGTDVDALIESFIDQHEPKLRYRHIKVVRLVNNRIDEEYATRTWLSDTVKHQLTFIELPAKTVEQRYIEFQFLNCKTQEAFRPPVLLVLPSYGCRYVDILEQVKQIQSHLNSVTNTSIDATDYLYWINDSGDVRLLKSEMSRNDTLLFLNRITIEMDPAWIEKYQSQYNFDRPSNKPSLNSLLADFFHEETLHGDYYCSQCQSLNEARQKTDLALPLPPVLIIQLKRFTYDVYSDAKIDTYIDFPLTSLDLSQYVIQNSKDKVNVSALYDLVAVSNHTGTLISGHYTTYAKNDRNQTWYSFNDERVRKIKDGKDIVTKNAYILVYTKQTTS